MELRRRVSATARSEFRVLFSGRRGLVLIVVALGWFLSLGVRLMYPALLPFLRPAFDMDLTTAGLLLAVLWGTYAFGQLPGGMLGDIIGSRLTLVGSTLLAGFAILNVASSSTAWWLFVGTAIFGFSTAMYGPTRIALLSTVFTDRSGTAIGITYATGTLGNATLPLVASSIAVAISWQMGFAYVVPLFLVIGVSLWFVLPPRDVAHENGSGGGIFDVLRGTFSAVTNSVILITTVVAVFAAFLFQSITGFYPIYLVEVKGLSPQVAAGLFSLFFLVGMGMQLLSGIGADRIGMRPTLIMFFGMLLVGLIVLPFTDRFVFLLLLSGLLSSILGYAPALQAFIAETLPDEVTGSGLGLLRTMFMLVGALGPLTIGAIADRGYFNEAFFLLAGIAGLAILMTILFVTSGES